MQNFTLTHLNIVVDYAENKFNRITSSLKKAVEEVADYLDAPQEFFSGKEIVNDVKDTRQKILECALKCAALADESALAELCDINKSRAAGIAFKNEDPLYIQLSAQALQLRRIHRYRDYYGKKRRSILSYPSFR